MQFGKSVSSPPRDCNSLITSFQRNIEIAGAIKHVSKIGKHAPFEFETRSGTASECDRLSELAGGFVKFARGCMCKCITDH